MASIPNVICAWAFVLLSSVDVSLQRMVRGEESSFLMQQLRLQEERLSRPPALLADLQVPEGQLQPPFSSNNFNYIVIVPEDVHDIHVTARLALGKENDRFRVRMTSSNLEADMYGSTMVLERNASTIYVKVHVSSHKLQTSTYSLKVVSGPSDVPAADDDDDPAGGADKKLPFGEALLNTILIFGAAMAVSCVVMFFYGTLVTRRSRQTVGVEGYQPINGYP